MPETPGDLLARERRGSDAAAQALAGIESVLRGERPHFMTEYECHAPGEQRWFAMRVTPLRHP